MSAAFSKNKGLLHRQFKIPQDKPLPPKLLIGCAEWKGKKPKYFRKSQAEWEKLQKRCRVALVGKGYRKWPQGYWRKL